MTIRKFNPKDFMKPDHEKYHYSIEQIGRIRASQEGVTRISLPLSYAGLSDAGDHVFEMAIPDTAERGPEIRSNAMISIDVFSVDCHQWILGVPVLYWVSPSRSFSFLLVIDHRVFDQRKKIDEAVKNKDYEQAQVIREQVLEAVKGFKVYK